MLKNVGEYEKLANFTAIPSLEPLVNIPDEIAKNMSTDQDHAWRFLNAVTSGHLSAEVAALKIGVMCHSR